MLTISENVVLTFSRHARGEAIAKLIRVLSEERPSLQHDPDLTQRVTQMVDWAGNNGINLEFDIYEMARLVFVHDIDVIADNDLKALLSEPNNERRFIMLRYFERKPPGFWRTSE